MSETQQINYVNLWLDYRPNTDLAIIREGHTVERILKDEWQTRAKELKTILTNMKPMLDSDVPCNRVAYKYNDG